jgi:hypothetical protein
MIRLKCDNCEKPIDVEDNLAGQKVKCPSCGDVNVVPGGPDRAAAAGYPSATGPEQHVMRVRRAMFRARPVTFLVLVLVFLGGLAAVVYFGTMANPANPALAVTGAIVGFLAVLILAAWKFTTLGESLEITNKRTIERTGILSKFTSEVRHQDIRNIQVTQSFRERLFGVGKIGISSAGQEGLEIVANDIPNPEKIRSVIDLYRAM